MLRSPPAAGFRARRIDAGHDASPPVPILDIAVIGSGISGLSAAWLLSSAHQVTLFEAETRAGGHSHTVEVRCGKATVPVDTGFIVYNEPAYPNLTALFDHLGVATAPSDMSFAVSLDDGALEYAGTSLSGLFAQRCNVAKPRFWSMLGDLARFYRRAAREAPAFGDAPLDAYLDAQGYGRAFRDDHLYPMAAAIWSAPASDIGRYPTAAFIRFCENHGLLSLFGRPTWRTVQGGSVRYVQRMRRGLSGRLWLDHPVQEVARVEDGVRLRTRAGWLPKRFDHVVVGTHADQALRLLGDADGREARLLGSFGYTRNHAVLHSDATLMPKLRRAWSSWNYLSSRATDAPSSVTYWMNRLQNLDTPAPIFVTLNPPRAPGRGHLLHTQVYEHPVFDVAALGAQRELWSLQGRRRTWFCGAYFGAGFHEDGLQAGLAVAEAIGGVWRPWRVADESGRIVLDPLPANVS